MAEYNWPRSGTASTHTVLEGINLFNGTRSISFTGDDDAYQKPPYQWFASVSPPFQRATAEKNAEEKAKYHGRAQIQIQIEAAVPSRFKELSVGTYGADNVYCYAGPWMARVKQIETAFGFEMD